MTGLRGVSGVGATASVGDYLVLHGDTGSKSPVAAFDPSVLMSTCADRPASPNQLTTIFQPSDG